jgi:hypothetical protein
LDLEKLFKGEYAINELAEIKKTESSKIGKKVA